MLNISNFMLELNNIQYPMKKTKTLLIITISLAVTYIAGIFAYATMSPIDMMDYVVFAGIGLIVIFSLLLVLKRYQDEKKGLVTEDELSRQVKEKAASRAFIFSIYWWTMIMMFTMDTHISHETILGIGIMGMGLIFLGLWYYYNKEGIANENTH